MRLFEAHFEIYFPISSSSHRPALSGSTLGLGSLGLGVGLGDSSSDLTSGFGDATCEIYAGDLLDEFEETKYNPLWTMKG